MSVTTMSRQTETAYLRLCPEKRRKNNLVHKGSKKRFNAQEDIGVSFD